MSRPAAALAAFWLAASPAASCEVALVLAVDVSGSVDPQEYDLQMEGLAAALGDPTVRDALTGAAAEVAVIQWSGSSRQSIVAPWSAMRGEADVDRLIEAVEAAPRAFRHFSTAIGDALSFSADMLGEVAGRCARLVVDVSGDGPSNEGADVGAMRDALVRGGVLINGLAIEISEPGLSDYYRDEVIGGPGSFVMTARDFADYPRAIRRKLLRELTAPVVDAAPPPRAASPG
ncbi:MAG: DUF1194 domain-containing protein [Pseudomonadota bacterium]